MSAIAQLDELIQQAQVEPNTKFYLDRGPTGDAELLARQLGYEIKYDHALKRWFIWRGNRWGIDRKGEVWNYVTTRLIPEYLKAAADAAQAGDDKMAKAYTRRADELYRRRRIEDVLYIMARLPGVSMEGDELDNAPMLLAVENGVIELIDGTHRAGTPDDYLKAYAPTAWKGIDYPAPRFEQFIQEAFDCEAEVIHFIQKWLGYCITGKLSEHRLPILYGEGRNGKSTLLQVLAYVLGGELTYSTVADTLMESKRDGAGPQPFQYALRGKRLVWASDGGKQGQRLAAGITKLLTGGDQITTRTLFSDIVTFNPSHKIMLLTNSKPHVDPEDTALWDRVLLVSFNNRFVDTPSQPGEYKRDPQLLETLQAEASGVLAWLVKGCLMWQAEGLNPPAQVLAATEAYRSEEDTLGEFIAECLIVGSNYQTHKKDILSKYTEWTRENNISNPMSGIALAKRLKRRFGDALNTDDRDAKGTIYHGLGVVL